MAAMVSARVPETTRDQVLELLKANGSSPTELINAAFEYYLAEQKLPEAPRAPKPGVRLVYEAMRAELDAWIGSFAIDGSSLPRSLSKEEIRRARLEARYPELFASADEG